jgi:hypothetical protein
MYKLQAHPAITSGQVAAPFELQDPVVTTIANGAVWSLVGNPWADIIITPVTTQTNMNCGVPLVAVGTGTEAAPIYTWLQTWGTCSVLGDTVALVAGTGILGQGAAAGSVTTELAAGASLTQRVGIGYISNATASVHKIIFLQIAP